MPETQTPVKPPTAAPPLPGAAFTPEDIIAAEIAATLAGALHGAQDREAVAEYLKLIVRLEGADDDALTPIGEHVRDLIYTRLPKPSGVQLSLLLPSEAADLADQEEEEGEAPRGYAREMLYRSLFAVNSAKRLARAYDEEDPDAYEAQLNRERAYFKAHQRVAKHREGHLAMIDEAARQFGDVLSWRAVLDSSTTAECRAAHGKNFSVTNPPMIGLPGLVHPLCRCVPGPPRNNAPLL